MSERNEKELLRYQGKLRRRFFLIELALCLIPPLFVDTPSYFLSLSISGAIAVLVTILVYISYLLFVAKLAPLLNFVNARYGKGPHFNPPN